MWMKKNIITLHMLYFAIETKLIAHIPGLMEPITCDQNIVKILAAFKIATLKKATFTVLYHKHVLSEVRTLVLLRLCFNYLTMCIALHVQKKCAMACSIAFTVRTNLWKLVGNSIQKRPQLNALKTDWMVST